MKKKFIIIFFVMLLAVNAFGYGEFYVDCIPAGVTSAGKENDPTFLAGYVDVTWYGADPTGVNDSTTAIHNAILEARGCNYSVFFPHQADGSKGRYRITDTINCRIKYPAAWNDGQQSVKLIGDRSVTGQRPEIFLADGTSGFADPANPKPMIRYWQQDSGTGDEDWTLNDADVNFGAVLRGIDVTTGNNAGAIGIEMPAAQGSYVQDSHINATGGLSCLGNVSCLGMNVMNCTLEGGQYAVYVNTAAYGAESQYMGAGVTFVGDTFKNQTSANFYLTAGDWTGPIVAIGCYFENSNSDVEFNSGRPARNNGFVIVDSIVYGNNSTAWIDKLAADCLVIRNSYFKGISTIVSGFTVTDSTDWTWVKYYTHDGDNTGDTGYVNLINGTTSSNTVYSYKEEGKTYTLQQLRDSLMAKHIWDEWDFPDWQDSDIYNVKDAGAKGDGVTDDTVAIQSALDSHEKVYFPRGKYFISNTITINANNKIIGSGLDNCIIKPHPDWHPSTTSPTIIVDTEDSATGSAILAFIRIGHNMIDKDADRVIDEWVDANTGWTVADQFQFQHLRWRVGENSMVRAVTFNKGYPWLDTTQQYKEFDAVEITGNGGGRWWGTTCGVRACEYTARILKIHDTTGQVLRFYSWNDANCPDSDPSLEIDGDHIFWYGPTHEVKRWMYCSNMSDYAVFGSFGNSAAPSDDTKAIIKLTEVSDVELLGNRENLYSIDVGYNVLREDYAGNIYKIEDKCIGRMIRGEAEYLSIEVEEEPPPGEPYPYNIDGGTLFQGGAYFR